jgi:tetratricopeptide (TPR) repeat protein
VWGVAIALSSEDRLPRGPKREFAEALHDLYDLAGQPAARQVSRAVYRRPQELESISHETVSSTLRGDIVPAWPKVQAMVTIFTEMSVRDHDVDAEINRMHQLWLTARRSAATDPVPADDAPAPPAQPAIDFYDAPSAWLPPAPQRDDPPPEEQERIIGPLPDRNPLFTGREILLDAMRVYHVTHPNAPLVVYGIGGVGKTQLAREYVHRFAEEYAAVWWLPAEPVEEAGKAMVGLAERLQLPVRPSTEQTVAGVLAELESRSVRFLLVFDGAENADIRRLIPTIGGNVLVTTRNPAWAHDSTNSRLEVADFDEAEAIQFLRKGDPTMNGQQATDLIGRVGRLPLALAQLIALRQGADMTWVELLHRLDQPERRLLSTAAEPAHYPNTVASNLRLALEQLQRANPVAVLVYELFAWFGPEPVSMSLLRCGASAAVSPELQRALSNSNPIMLNRIVADINRFGLGRLHTQDQRIEVQPMMRLALRDSLSYEDSARAQHNVHAILTAADLGSPDEVMWDLHRAMAPHVLPSGLPQSRLEAAHRAVYHQVRYRYLLGDLEDARRLGEAAATTWQEPGFLGPDAEFVLLTKREWANALRALGHYPQAREIDADVMRRMKDSRDFGENHLYTLDAARGYAADLRIAGDYRSALDLDQGSYQRLSEHHASDEDRIGISHHNVAVSHRLLGAFAKAELIDRDEWARRRDHRGRDDRRTRLSLNALAEDLFGLGRFNEVLELEPDSLTTADGVVRPGELGLLLASRTIGLANRRLGRLGRATELLQAHYTECAASFGADHGFTLAATLSYANALRERRLLGLAYSLAVDAVGGYERAFGPTNPLTQAARVDLAVILRARGAVRDALRTDEAALRNLRESVGDMHPFTIVARINLAIDQSLTGSAAAGRTAREAYQFAHDVLGRHHFDTLSAAANLALFTPDPGPNSDGVLADLRRTLGPDHPRITEVAKGHRVDCDVEPPSL